MPVPALAYSALTAAPSVYGLIKAQEQKRQADKLANIKQPAYQISEAYNTARTIARKNALLTKIPGYEAIAGKIGASTANQIRNINEVAGSGTDAIAAGSAAVGQQQDSLTNLGIAGEQMWQQNQGTLMNAENLYGQQEEKKQDWDVLQPYMRAKETESGLRNASNENTMGAIKGITGAISGGLFLADQQGGGTTKSSIKSPATSISWNPSPIFPDASSQPPSMSSQTMISPELRQVAIQKYRILHPDSPLTDEQILSVVG